MTMQIQAGTTQEKPVLRQYSLTSQLYRYAYGLVIVYFGLHSGIALSSEDIGAELQRSAELSELIIPLPYDGSSEVLEAKALWESLAASGDADAQYYLAVLYFRGLGGVEKNRELAFSYLDEAAKGGNSTARVRLAMAYEVGEIIDVETNQSLPSDRNIAITLYTLAAESGNQYAIARLITIFEKGLLGITPNPAAVEKWSKKLDEIEECTRQAQVDCSDH